MVILRWEIPLLESLCNEVSGLETCNFIIIFFNWDSLHAQLSSQYKAWSYKKKKHKKIKAYNKSLQKEPTVNRCLLILDLKPFRLQVKGKFCWHRIPESSCARKETVDIEILVTCRNAQFVRGFQSPIFKAPTS